MPTQFSIIPATANVQSTPGSLTITTSSAGGGWTATTVADWITISPSAGDQIDNTTVVSYNQNTGSESRIGVVSFITETSSEATLTITQAAASEPGGGNIFVGGDSMVIMLGNDEIPAIYCGDELLYPINLGTLTGITLVNLTWVTDVPYSGGTADKDNCSYRVVGLYDSGKSRTVTRDATVTGSLVVPAGTGDTREAVGTLELTATYSGFTASGSVTAYQDGPVFEPTGYLHFNNVSGVSITTDFSPNQVYTNGGNYMRIEVNVDFNSDRGSLNYLWNGGNGGNTWFSFEQGPTGYGAYQNLGSSTIRGSGNPIDRWNTCGTTYTDVFTYNNGDWRMQRTPSGPDVTGSWSGTLGTADGVLIFFPFNNTDLSFYRFKVFDSPSATEPVYDFCPYLDGNNIPCIYESINRTYHYSSNPSKISFIPFE